MNKLVHNSIVVCHGFQPASLDNPTETAAVRSENSEERAWSPGEVQQLRRRGPRAAAPAAPSPNLGFLAEGLAHDLNNVLAPVVTTLEIMQRCCPPQDRFADLLQMSQRHARLGVALIQQILSLVHGVEHAYACVQPGSFLRDLRKQVTHSLPETIRVQVDTAPELWPVLGSLAELHQALLNFCLRAQHALPHGGTLTLSAKNIWVDDDYPFVEAGTPASRYVRFTIADNGRGLSEELQEFIFSGAVEAGCQLGGEAGLLAYAEAVVKRHNGHVTVSSELDTGTIFHIYLPAAPGSASSALREERSLPRGLGEWILVVDDEPGFVAATQAMFEAYGYQVLTAANGAAAVARYLEHRQKIALVLLDMTMPFMDGQKAMSILRHINPDVQIIATSGLNAKSQKAKTIAAGVRHFIPKPFEVTQLMQLVDGLLHSGQSAA